MFEKCQSGHTCHGVAQHGKRSIVGGVGCALVVATISLGGGGDGHGAANAWALRVKGRGQCRDPYTNR
jgi:hypothetical protein